MKFPPPTAAKFSIASRARVSGGTDMRVLARTIADKYNLELSTTNDPDALAVCLKAGGMAIANVGGNRGEYKGVFSNGGHYIVIASIDGETMTVLAPGLYSGKNSGVYRSKLVKASGTEIFASIDTLDRDCDNRSPRYYLFKNHNTKEDDDDMARVLYKKLADIPNKYGFRDNIETLMDAGIINGDGSDPDGNEDDINLYDDQVRTLVFIYRGGGFDRKLIEKSMKPVVKD